MSTTSNSSQRFVANGAIDGVMIQERGHSFRQSASSLVMLQVANESVSYSCKESDAHSLDSTDL